MILCFENGAPNYLRVDGEGGGISENNKTLRRHVNKIDEKYLLRLRFSLLTKYYNVIAKI